MLCALEFAKYDLALMGYASVWLRPDTWNRCLCLKSGKMPYRLHHFNRFLIDFYPKDIKEIAAGSGSWWGIASQEITQKNENLWAEPRN